MKNFAYGVILGASAATIVNIAAVDFGMRLPPHMVVWVCILAAITFFAVDAIKEN